MKKQTKNIARLEGYNEIYNDIKFLLDKAKVQAYKAVDNIRVQVYWQVGERIVRGELQHKERADYGKKLIVNLANDSGFTRQMLSRIVQFYREYPIVTALRVQLSWTHYELLVGISSKEERQFYETRSIINSWSTRELEKRIKNKEYGKMKKKREIIIRLPEQLPSPEDVFKESYDWDFLELEKSHEEKELEKALLNKIEKVLLEFGKGFAFMGSQLKILIAGQYHKIDLVFYNRLLKCIVLVELKTEKFRREFVAQMNEYLTYTREHDKLEGERDPIGLIICKEKDEEEVHYALGRLKQEIFVAEYKTKLPSEEEIEARIKK